MDEKIDETLKVMQDYEVIALQFCDFIGLCQLLGTVLVGFLGLYVLSWLVGGKANWKGTEASRKRWWRMSHLFGLVGVIVFNWWLQQPIKEFGETTFRVASALEEIGEDGVLKKKHLASGAMVVKMLDSPPRCIDQLSVDWRGYFTILPATVIAIHRSPFIRSQLEKKKLTESETDFFFFLLAVQWIAITGFCYLLCCMLRFIWRPETEE